MIAMFAQGALAEMVQSKAHFFNRAPAAMLQSAPMETLGPILAVSSTLAVLSITTLPLMLAPFASLHSASLHHPHSLPHETKRRERNTYSDGELAAAVLR